MIVVEEGKTYRVTGTTGLFDYDKYTARTKFQWRVGDSSDPFRAGVYDQGEETRLPPTTGPERIVNLEAEELLEPKLGDNATYRIKRILYQAMKRNGGAVGNGSSITKPADGKTYRWYQALLIERASDGKACFVWTVYDDKDYIKLVEELSQPEAPPAVDVSVTIAAGKTTYIAAVVEGGAITKMVKKTLDGVLSGAGGDVLAGGGSDDTSRRTLQNWFKPMEDKNTVSSLPPNGTYKFVIRSQEFPKIDNRPATVIQNIRDQLGTPENRTWLTAQTAAAMTDVAFKTLENLILFQALLAELDDTANTIVAYSTSGRVHTDAFPPIRSRYRPERVEGSFELGRSAAGGPHQWMATVRFTALGSGSPGGDDDEIVEFAISNVGKIIWVAYYAVPPGQPPPPQGPPDPALPGTLWHAELYHSTLGFIGVIAYDQASLLFQNNAGLNPPFQLRTYYGVRTPQFIPHNAGRQLNAIIPSGRDPGDGAWDISNGTVLGFHIIVTMPPPANM